LFSNFLAKNIFSDFQIQTFIFSSNFSKDYFQKKVFRFEQKIKKDV